MPLFPELIVTTLGPWSQPCHWRTNTHQQLVEPMRPQKRLNRFFVNVRRASYDDQASQFKAEQTLKRFMMGNEYDGLSPGEVNSHIPRRGFR